MVVEGAERRGTPGAPAPPPPAVPNRWRGPRRQPRAHELPTAVVKDTPHPSLRGAECWVPPSEDGQGTRQWRAMPVGPRPRRRRRRPARQWRRCQRGRHVRHGRRHRGRPHPIRAPSWRAGSRAQRAASPRQSVAQIRARGSDSAASACPSVRDLGSRCFVRVHPPPAHVCPLSNTATGTMPCWGRRASLATCR